RERDLQGDRVTGRREGARASRLSLYTCHLVSPLRWLALLREALASCRELAERAKFLVRDPVELGFDLPDLRAFGRDEERLHVVAAEGHAGRLLGDRNDTPLLARRLVDLDARRRRSVDVADPVDRESVRRRIFWPDVDELRPLTERPVVIDDVLAD